jgi:signal transduction histidine kinase
LGNPRVSMNVNSPPKSVRGPRNGSFIGWLRAPEQRAFCAQVTVVFVMITLLNIGYFFMREVREIDLRNNLQRVIHGWDGLAWYTWLAAAPAIYWLRRRFPVSRDHWLRGVAGLVSGSVVIYLLVANSRFLIRLASDELQSGRATTTFSWTNYLHTESVLMPIDFLTYFTFFAVSFSIDYYINHHQRVHEVMRLELQAAQLQSELTKAQLAMLRGQLRPHFLFNAFNAIATLVRQRKNEQAIEMIAQLGDLLRLTIENIDLQEQSLEEEFDFAGRYLNLERVRYSDKLRTEMELAASARGCVVPYLLLYPLVENAVKHGISQRVDPGLVKVTAARVGDRLRLEVIDDGPGMEIEPAGRTGGALGLRATRGRLHHAYGDNYGLEIARRPDGGTEVRLDLPWRERSLPAKVSLESGTS